MESRLLNILACPNCCRSLRLMKKKNQLFCEFDKLYFNIQDGIPIFLKTTLSNTFKKM